MTDIVDSPPSEITELLAIKQFSVQLEPIAAQLAATLKSRQPMVSSSVTDYNNTRDCCKSSPRTNTAGGEEVSDVSGIHRNLVDVACSALAQTLANMTAARLHNTKDISETVARSNIDRVNISTGQSQYRTDNPAQICESRALKRKLDDLLEAGADRDSALSKSLPSSPPGSPPELDRHSRSFTNFKRPVKIRRRSVNTYSTNKSCQPGKGAELFSSAVKARAVSGVSKTTIHAAVDTSKQIAALIRKHQTYEHDSNSPESRKKVILKAITIQAASLVTGFVETNLKELRVKLLTGVVPQAIKIAKAVAEELQSPRLVNKVVWKAAELLPVTLQQAGVNEPLSNLISRTVMVLVAARAEKSVSSSDAV